MTDELSIELAGEPVRLYAERALFWPRAATLIVADLHLGKADHFRRAGIALPRGGTSLDLERLDALIVRSGATRLLVLGDLVHGALPDAPWRATWVEWRQRHAGLRVELVAGNHDRRLRRNAAALDALQLHLHEGSLGEAPFLFAHDEHDVDAGSAGYVLSGHLHPVVRLPGLPRLPAFRFGRSGGVLPAFTAFAGGLAIDPQAGDRVFVCAPNALVEVPGAPI